MNVTESIRTRKRLLGASVLIITLIVGAMLQMNAPTTTAQSTGGFETVIYDIVPDAMTLSTLPAPGSTFVLTGRVYTFRSVNQATCDLSPAAELGVWRGWGQVTDGGRIVINHSLQLDAFNGSIEVQGTSGSTLAMLPAAPAVAGSSGPPFTGPSEAMAVTGGTGTFRGMSGEAHIRPYCQSEEETHQEFRYDRPFCLNVVETSRRRGQLR